MLTIILSLLALALIIRYFRKRNDMYRDVYSMPGPTPLPLLGNILDLGSSPCSILANLLRLTEEYGPIYKLWMGPTTVSVVVTGPQYIEDILVTKSITDKGLFYKFVGFWFGDAFAVASGDKWYKTRKYIAPVFNAITVKTFISVFNANADKFINNLKELDLQQFANIEQIIAPFAVDNVRQTLLCATCDKESTQEILENFRKQSRIIMSRMFSPISRFDVFFKFTKDHRRQGKLAAEGNKLLDRVIVDRRDTMRSSEHAEKNKKLLDMLLERCDCEDDYTLKRMRDDLISIIVGGFETILGALCFCMYELSKRPDIQTKLLEEFDMILGSDCNVDADVTIEDINKMIYLQCVIKESLRMYTPAPIIERTSPDDIILDGKFIPKGTSLLIFLHGTHRSKNLYSEPNKFDPDRFLPENSSNIDPKAFVPFSSGIRNCVAKKFALLEMKVFMCKLIRNFEITPGQQGHEPMLEINVSLRSVNGLPMKFKPRTSKPVKS